MAYASTSAPIRKIADAGIYGRRTTDNTLMNGPGSIWAYVSSHGSTDVGGVTGFFAACGAQPSSGAGQGNLARSVNNVGMAFADLVAVIESSAGAVPGRITWHAVKGSTFNQASTSASSAFTSSAGFDVTVSSATT
jgi:hypothetical protein